MENKIEHFKKHVKDNKKIYIAGAVGVGVGIIATAVIIYTKQPTINTGLNGSRVNSGGDFLVNSTIVNFLERSTPSKPVHLVDSNLYYDSLSDAARKTGHSLSQISKNVNGHIPDVNGDVFQLLNLS